MPKRGSVRDKARRFAAPARGEAAIGSRQRLTGDGWDRNEKVYSLTHV